MNNITYNQILTYFSSIAYHHEQIMSFGVGDFTQITNDVETKQEPRYTRMYVIPSNVEFNQNHIHYNFSVVIMDKVEDDLSNLQEVMSDTLDIVKDIWTVFYRSYTEQQGWFSNIIMGDWEPDCNPFTERFETILGGWTMNIRMSAPFDYNSCVIPMDNGYIFPQDESFSSYQQIIKDFESFAENHKQIESFGYGDETLITNDIETKVEPLYPRIYFVPERTKLNQNYLNITWKVIVVDKLEDDLSNQVEVLSDTLEIVKDFYAKAYLSDYDVEWNAMLEPMLENTETILAGWTLTVSIQQKFDYNRCVLPVTSFIPGLTWEQVVQMWKDVNKNWKNV